MEHMNKRSSYSVPDNDRISDLPDSILAHILSFLPTKDAVATCILSHRWTSLWMLTTNLEIRSCDMNSSCRIYFSSDNEKEMYEYRFVSEFIDRVNYVLLHHKPAYLNRVCLALRDDWNCEHVKLGTWISAWINVGIAKNVQELCLHFSVLPIHAQRSIFSYEGLISLTFDCNVCLSSEIVVSLPKLERLKLVSVYFLDEEAFYRLICGCPVLKRLTIDMDCGKLKSRPDIDSIDGTHHVFKCKISSTSLTHLKVLAAGIRYTDFKGTFLCIQLDTPLLEYIKLEGQIYNVLIQQPSLLSLVKVCFELDLSVSGSELQNSFHSVVQAFRSFDCAKTLIVSAQTIRAFSCATIETRTKFKRLTKLEVTMEDSYRCGSLLDFISLFDSLELLSVYKNYDSTEDDFSNSNWKQLIRLPSCLSNSLMTVVFREFDGHEDELAVVAYILQHGSVLQHMQVYFDDTVEDFKAKFELVQKIYMFPRASPVCEVECINSFS